MQNQENLDGDAAKPPHAVALNIRNKGEHWQRSLTNITTCGKPVIACVHGACIGAGIEMISACDVRWATRCMM